MKKQALILSAALLMSFSLLAQGEEEVIRNMIREMNANISDLQKDGGDQAGKVMSHANLDFQYNRKVINILNIVNHQRFDRETTAFILKEMRASNLINKRTLGSLDQVVVRNNLAMAMYTCDYELYDDKSLLNKGKQYVQLILKKVGDGGWKVSWMDVLSLDDATYKSTCICELDESAGPKNMTTNTIVPNGHEAEVVKNNFTIDESIDPREIMHGSQAYAWASNGPVYKKNQDGSKGQQLGNAATRHEAFMVILKGDLYPDRCNLVARKLK